ncbi:MAG: acyl carrier protein [Gammaproteobacteria bacterium]|nr:acyl carrier protein [Gammaproteobacteria bacterium]
MSSTEDRLKKLVQENLDTGREPDLDIKFSDSGVSSVDAVAFIKLVGQQFNVEIPPEDFSQFQSLRDLAKYIDSRA